MPSAKLLLAKMKPTEAWKCAVCVQMLGAGGTGVVDRLRHGRRRFSLLGSFVPCAPYYQKNTCHK